MKRTLVLKRETLTELTNRDLAAVAGAVSGDCTTTTQTTSRAEDCDLPTIPVVYCLTLAGPRCIY